MRYGSSVTCVAFSTLCPLVWCYVLYSTIYGYANAILNEMAWREPERWTKNKLTFLFASLHWAFVCDIIMHGSGFKLIFSRFVCNSLSVFCVQHEICLHHWLYTTYKDRDMGNFISTIHLYSQLKSKNSFKNVIK